MKNINKIKPKNALVYVRVSSKEQILNFSLGSQEKTCREYALKHGYEVLEIFREEGESAKTANRTQLQLMLRYCEKNKNKIGIIIFYKVDRLSRSSFDYPYLKYSLNKMGITLVSATENIEDTPAGKLYENMLISFAEFDNNVKSQRTFDGMKARTLKGYVNSKAPWGYVNTIDRLGNKIIIPHPERAPIIKMLFEEYATGKYTFKELAKKVNKTGLKSRRGIKFYKQLVANIIKNPVYYGWIISPKFEISIKGNHEPIISEKLFIEAQSARNKSASKKFPRNIDNPMYPLRGVRCGGCGRSISGGKSKGRGKYYHYYSCYCYECGKRTSINKEIFENDFTSLLKDVTPDDNLFEVLKETIKIAHKQELQSTTATKAGFESKILERKDKKEKLLDLRLAGKISDEDFTEANEKIKFDIYEHEKAINEIFIPELELENVIDSSLDFLKHLPKEWKNLDVKDLRVLRELIFPRNIEYTYPGFKTAELSIVYKLKSEFTDNEKHFVRLIGIEPSRSH